MVKPDREAKIRARVEKRENVYTVLFNKNYQEALITPLVFN